MWSTNEERKRRSSDKRRRRKEEEGPIRAWDRGQCGAERPRTDKETRIKGSEAQTGESDVQLQPPAF